MNASLPEILRAIKEDDWKSLEELLRWVRDIEAHYSTDLGRLKLLSYAAANGSLKAAKVLKRFGADIHDRLGGPFTYNEPLVMAILAKEFHFAGWLIGQGVNLKASDGVLFLSSSDPEILQYVLSHGGRLEKLQKAEELKKIKKPRRFRA